MKQQQFSISNGVGIELMLPMNARINLRVGQNMIGFRLPYYEDSVHIYINMIDSRSSTLTENSSITTKEKAEASFREMFNANLTNFYFIPPSRLKDAASVGYYYESIFPRLPMERHVEYFVKYQQDIYWISIITEPDNFERLRPAIYNILRSIRIIDISDLQEKHSNEALY